MATREHGDLTWYMCPKCGACLGFVTQDHNLLMPGRYTNATLKCGTLVCQCGHVVVWHEAKEALPKAT
jgi:hypothetical protein